MASYSSPNRAHSLGRWGEARAASWLGRRGWRVLARNYRFGRREVDLVLTRGGLVVFVEVKTRSGDGFGGGAGAITWRKRREIEAVAAHFLATRGLSDRRVRFDAVVVTTDAVCLNSTKSTLRSADVDRFVEEIAVFRRFCPEFDALPLVGILASLAVDESVLRYAEEMGFVVIAVGDALMEVKNRPGFEPKPWLAAGRGLGAD